MTSEATTPPAPQDPPHPFTETGLARLMLSHAYQEVADSALGGISTSSDGYAQPGGFVERALRMLRETEDVLRWAVVYERERGTSWDDIGEALGPITRQSAHRRFADQVEQWRAPLDEPETVRVNGTSEDPRIPYPASDPEKAARHLDSWLKERTVAHDAWARDDRPVSDHLDRHTTLSAMIIIGKYTSRLLKDQIVPDPHKQADAADLHADLLERLDREGGAGPDAAKQIAKERARAQALRTIPGHGVTWHEVGNPLRWLEEAWERTVARFPEVPSLARVRVVDEVAGAAMLEADPEAHRAIEQDPDFRRQVLAVLADEAAPGHEIIRLISTERDEAQ